MARRNIAAQTRPRVGSKLRNGAPRTSSLLCQYRTAKVGSRKYDQSLCAPRQRKRTGEASDHCVLLLHGHRRAGQVQ